MIPRYMFLEGTCTVKLLLTEHPIQRYISKKLTSSQIFCFTCTCILKINSRLVAAPGFDFGSFRVASSLKFHCIIKLKVNDLNSHETFTGWQTRSQMSSICNIFNLIKMVFHQVYTVVNEGFSMPINGLIFRTRLNTSAKINFEII